MRLEDVKIGMRVKLTEAGMKSTHDIVNPYGTVRSISTQIEGPFGGLFTTKFPIDVEFDGVDYTLDIFKGPEGEQYYDLISPDEIEPAEEGAGQ